MIDSATRMGFLTFLPFLLKMKGADMAMIGVALTLIFTGGACGKLACGWLGARIGVVPATWVTEGATAIVEYAFGEVGLSEVVAITVISNQASRHVMEKLGMTHRPELDFNHPRVPAGHPSERHTLYSLRNPTLSEVPCSTRS